MNFYRVMLLTILLLSGDALLFASHGKAAQMQLAGGLRLTVKSMVDKRFDRIFRQQYDFSCGSATLASLLSFHYNDAVTELTVFEDMFEHGDQNKIRQQGFSLLDMKRFLTRRGYRSNGFSVSLEQLAAAQRPAITIINSNGYLHFVIVKAQRDDTVIIGDPASGLKLLPVTEFEAMRQGRIFFLIESNPEQAAYHYEFDQTMRSYAPAQLGFPVDLLRLDVLTVMPAGQWDF